MITRTSHRDRADLQTALTGTPPCGRCEGAGGDPNPPADPTGSSTRFGPREGLSDASGKVKRYYKSPKRSSARHERARIPLVRSVRRPPHSPRGAEGRRGRRGAQHPLAGPAPASRPTQRVSAGLQLDGSPVIWLGDTCQKAIGITSAPLGGLSLLFGPLAGVVFVANLHNAIVAGQACNEAGLTQQKADYFDCLQPGCSGFDPKQKGGPCETCTATCCVDPTVIGGYVLRARLRLRERRRRLPQRRQSLLRAREATRGCQPRPRARSRELRSATRPRGRTPPREVVAASSHVDVFVRPYAESSEARIGAEVEREAFQTRPYAPRHFTATWWWSNAGVRRVSR